MVDAFSISTGVAGFMSLAIEISKFLSSYSSSFKSAREDAQRLHTEIDALCHVLKELIQFLRNEDNKAMNGPFEKTSFLCSSIELCQSEVQKLYKKFSKFHGVDKSKMAELIERIKWPLRKDDFENTVAALQRLTPTFQFSLLVSNR
jgi:CRISPR/Cas system CSM-associated protein Csm2 small subunit